MQTQTRLITLQAVTFLHPGTGQTTGVVDLPIQREIHTGHPMFAASGLKGSLRDKAENGNELNADEIKTLFGSSVGDENNNKDGKTSAGTLSVTDARILAFPVRSLQQVFVWVTCPMVIERLLRDVGLIGFPLDQVPLADAITLMEADALVATGSGLTSPLILEELSFETKTNACADKVAELIQKLVHDSAGFDPKRLVIIPNTEFQHLVRYATQVSARIQLNDRKTTDGDGGNLWYEETLPPETILYALALCHSPRQGKDNQDNKTTITDAKGVANKLDELLKDRFLQIGGNETVGQGWCSVKVNAPNGNGEPA